LDRQPIAGHLVVGRSHVLLPWVNAALRYSPHNRADRMGPDDVVVAGHMRHVLATAVDHQGNDQEVERH